MAGFGFALHAKPADALKGAFSMEFFIISTLNGLSYGLLLFMFSAGLTLVLSMMGVLNFAHASFYMLGAYLGYSVSAYLGFWLALAVAPVLVGILGALVEHYLLRRVHAAGHGSELLVTFGLSYVVVELVQLFWGRTALEFSQPAALQGPAFTLVRDAAHGLHWLWGAAPADACVVQGTGLSNACSPFPLNRAFMALVALSMLLVLWLLLKRTRVGLLVQAALTHPDMVGALGHNVPRIFMLVFGVGSALAGLAGVVAGSTFVTEPSMAASMGSLAFVVVVLGGLGSLAGALIASLLLGLLQTFAVSTSMLTQIAPLLPYALLVLVLLVRPRGLWGLR